jgi:hypothetical protein
VFAGVCQSVVNLCWADSAEVLGLRFRNLRFTVIGASM